MAYQLLDGHEEKADAEQDLQYQYYFQLSADAFLHTDERKFILRDGVGLAQALLAEDPSPGDEADVRQWYYAGHFLWLQEAYPEALQCWERVSHFPPALYWLMYGYHRQEQMAARNDAVSRIIALEKQGVGLLPYTLPVLLGLPQDAAETEDAVFRYVYAREVAETLEVLSACVSQQHTFLSDFRAFLSARSPDIWQIPPATLAQVAHYETEALQQVLGQLKASVQNHSEEVAEWLQGQYPPNVALATGKLITTSYDDNLIQQQHNSTLLTYLFLSDKISQYDRLWLEVWNRVVALKKQKFKPVTEETLRSAITNALTVVTNQWLAGTGMEHIAFIKDIALIPVASALAALTARFVDHALGQDKVRGLPNNYPQFRADFVAYVKDLKEELGETTFNERYPLAGFDAWATQSSLSTDAAL